ncbi:MAG: tyrosine-type recombinase/integrase [Acidobacteria bacterium]|nr:tyrosine-type recombinase/integrase [Acidobacteriota bacterium]
MLRLYRRHRLSCPQTSERYRRCSCPIYIEGTLAGEYIRKAVDLTSWTAATGLIAKWNEAGEIGAVRPEVPTITEAVSKFFADATARQLQPATITKLKNLLEKRLVPWCEHKGFRQLKQLDVDALLQFRATWPDGPLSAYKNLERLRAFLWFCHRADWIQKNPAVALKPPKLPDKSTKVKVFTEDEIERVLDACDEYPERNAYGHDNRARIKALVLTLRYSGMRIGDCVGLQKAHLKADKLFLNTEKSGSKIFVPLPKVAVEAVEKIENGSAYFFWTGNGLRRSAVADWQRALRRLFELAEVTGNPHMFRHTFATDLLSRGIPIEDVSALLGHKSVRITESYYSHWIKARRDRLEERVRELWR